MKRNKIQKIILGLSVFFLGSVTQAEVVVPEKTVYKYTFTQEELDNCRYCAEVDVIEIWNTGITVMSNDITLYYNHEYLEENGVKKIKFQNVKNPDDVFVYTDY